ncbi:MAG: helix-turn-helix transcriptional regulator [Eubacteriales bacterium]|nr:helix-turn-helix transcriptional regulator [Eubacteriales bacterium]
MNLKIGETIKALRRQRDLTQEEVAAHLGISFQSVSKWERGEGYPDITMLPALANYFHVTVDELLGMDELAKAEQYAKINAQWSENRKQGLHEQNVALMREALKTYPNNALLLVQLSASLEAQQGTAEEKRENLRESAAIQEQILRYGYDSEIRAATMYNICFAYWKLGERKKALEQAEKLPNLYKARENALVYFLEGEEKQKNSREALVPLAWALSVHLKALAETEGNPAYLVKAEKVLEVLFGEDNELADSIRKLMKP